MMDIVPLCQALTCWLIYMHRTGRMLDAESTHACWKTGRWKAGRVRSPEGQGRAHLIAFRSVVEDNVQNDLNRAKMSQASSNKQASLLQHFKSTHCHISARMSLCKQ